ncbi:MAG: phosphoribosylamine--glycine ligase [Acidobacteriota bacterium]|nr:phosphoribosylamine--glycine ligase [Acidobacteriota bacterium]
MKVLVIGNGGREHALAWKLSQSALVEEILCAPGNPGTARLGRNIECRVDDVPGLVELAERENVDLTVVGPELPLSLGIVDAMQARGLTVYGPSQAAAQLESSKIFAKEFMVRHGVPTAQPFHVVESAEEARAAVAEMGIPHVLKADGLAAGKGVLMIRSESDFEEALEVFFGERRFGNAGARVLVEPLLEGEEVSFMGLSDGQQILPLATSKDYKRIGEDDTGPNTGGMGAHSPSAIVTAAEEEALVSEILEPTVNGMAAEGAPLVGVVYAGLMMTAGGPQVLEFNIRFGDPEAQALLLRLDDDLAQLLHDGASRGFQSSQLGFRQDAAACIVLGNHGYPSKASTGDVISGLTKADSRPGVEVFHAGTGVNGDHIIATGGRVLNVCALGTDLRDALERAYAACDDVYWPSKILRRDIGRRVLADAAATR